MSAPIYHFFAFMLCSCSVCFALWLRVSCVPVLNVLTTKLVDFGHQTRRLWSPNSSTLVAKLVEFVKMFSKNAVGVLTKRCWRSA